MTRKRFQKLARAYVTNFNKRGLDKGSYTRFMQAVESIVIKPGSAWSEWTYEKLWDIMFYPSKSMGIGVKRDA